MGTKKEEIFTNGENVMWRGRLTVCRLTTHIWIVPHR